MKQGDLLFVRAWLQEMTNWDGRALNVATLTTAADVGRIDKFTEYGFCWIKINNSSYELEMSPLHLAVSENQVEIVDALLSAPQYSPASIEFCSMGCHSEFQTPLAFAVCSGSDPRIIERLLQSNANASVRNDRQQTLLMMAALDDLVDAARVLLRHDGSLIDAQDARGRTALWLATTSRSRGMQRMLWQYGADVNIRSHVDGRTVLHEEVSQDEPSAEIVGLFVNGAGGAHCGADVEARTQSGATALMLAMRRSFEYDRDSRFLRDSIAVMRVLLEDGRAVVDIEDNHGVTPLHCAHNAAFLQVLLDSGNVNIDHANSRGETALHAACQVANSGGRVSMLLNEFRANRHVVETVHGRTPLHCAARAMNDTALLALLQGEGEGGQESVFRSMTARCTTHGRTALHELVWAMATRGSQPWVLEKYLNHASTSDERAALVNARDNRGWTPLHWASFRGDADAVRVLIHAGADVRAVDAKGRTSLHVACLTFINAKEWNEVIDIPHEILTNEHPMRQQDWDQIRTSDYGQLMTSFRGCGPPGGWFITCDVAKVLLYEGRANPSIIDNDGNLPFFLAAVLLDEHPELLDTVYMNIRAGAHVLLSENCTPDEDSN